MKKSTKTLLFIVITILVLTFIFVLITGWIPGILFFPVCFLLHSLNVAKFCFEKMSEL